MQASMDTPVEKCVTLLKRSMVGVLREPYIRRELWWQTNARLERCQKMGPKQLIAGRGGGPVYIPNEITPIAWNMPVLTVRSGVLKDPRASEGVMMPCTTTVTMMMIMLIRASVLAFAS